MSLAQVTNINNYQFKEKAYLLHGAHVYQLKGVSTIGNDTSCNIRFIVKGVDKRHCRITYTGDGFIIKDLKSAQGTYLNETKIIEAELNNGDIITLGESEFVFSHTPLINHKKNNQLTSKNHEWNSQLNKLPQYAESDHSILILGDSGTGKDIIAKAIHENSNRSHEKLISINCSALSSQLIESELFGHIKGSFTGAERDRNGAFVEAKNGTLFLDEIGDLPLHLQPKLLRALENHEIKPVGKDNCIKTNVRIIAATHKNLNELVAKGEFRQDLYFRLNILQLSPPSLINRMEDFNELFYIFAKKYRIRFDFNAIEYLKKYTWPGNIRELKNFIIKASVHFKGQFVTEDKIENFFNQQGIVINILQKNSIQNSSSSLLKKQEIETICSALSKYAGNQRKAALSIGIPTSTMCDKVKKYGINVKALKKQTYLDSLN